jgi:rRNA maturation endonuclease Nob1
LQHRITTVVASLQESLRKEPTYMLAETDVYSMQDLAEVKNGELVTRLKELVNSSSQHVAGCQVCFSDQWTTAYVVLVTFFKCEM